MARATLGSLSDPEFIRLGDFMTAAVERYPLLDIEFKHEITGLAFEHVREGTLDGASTMEICTGPRWPAKPLREIGYRVAAPAAWHERIESAGWDEIAAEPWILPPEVSTHHQLAQTLFRTHGANPAKLIGADHETDTGRLRGGGDRARKGEAAGGGEGAASTPTIGAPRLPGGVASSRSRRIE